MIYIILIVFLSGILCQPFNNFKDFPIDESARGWIDKAIDQLIGKKVASTSNDPSNRDSFESIVQYLGSFKNSNPLAEGNAQSVRDKSQPTGDKSQSIEDSIKPIEIIDQPIEIIDQPIENTDQPIEIIDQPIEIIDQPLKHNDQPIENKIPSENANQHMRNNALPFQGNAEAIENRKNYLENWFPPNEENFQPIYSNSLRTNNVDALSTTNGQHTAPLLLRQNTHTSSFKVRHPIQKSKRNMNTISRLDLQERGMACKETDAFERLSIMEKAFKNASKIGALKNPEILNKGSRQFLSASVIPILNCLKYHFNSDAAKFIEIQGGKLLYYDFGFRKCRGLPGKCTLPENGTK